MPKKQRNASLRRANNQKKLNSRMQPFDRVTHGQRVFPNEVVTTGALQDNVLGEMMDLAGWITPKLQDEAETFVCDKVIAQIQSTSTNHFMAHFYIVESTNGSVFVAGAGQNSQYLSDISLLQASYSVGDFDAKCIGRGVSQLKSEVRQDGVNYKTYEMRKTLDISKFVSAWIKNGWENKEEDDTTNLQLIAIFSTEQLVTVTSFPKAFFDSHYTFGHSGLSVILERNKQNQLR